MLRLRAFSLALIAVLAVAPSADARTKPAKEPALTTPAATLAAALTCPTTFSHPEHEPVLLVHGTGLDADESWGWNYAKVLPQQGFDTCAVTLPGDALGDIQTSTEYVVSAVRRIAAASGRKVDVITHSQGGMEGRWAVKWWRSARDAVDDLVLLASPNHGIWPADACRASGNCWPAVWQMGTDAAFIAALNRGDETPGAVSYTNVYSAVDELVEPSTTVPMDGAENIAVQAVCPGRPVHHGGLVHDAVAWALTLDALTHPGPASVARAGLAPCTRTTMPGVSEAEATQGNLLLYTSAAQAFSQHDGVSEEPPVRAYAR